MCGRITQISVIQSRTCGIECFEATQKTVCISGDASKSSKTIRNAEVFGILMKCRKSNASNK